MRMPGSMKFCCVTPCLNAAQHIERTMRAVLGQSYLLREGSALHYTIQDGGSRDDTLAVAERVAAEFADRSNIRVQVVSTPDGGMYDALARGFEQTPPGDVQAYLNAGDLFAPGAFEIVSEIFDRHGVEFLTGMNARLNEAGHVVDVLLPPRYRRSLLQRGCYGTRLPCVQQESTFWSGRLHAAVDWQGLRTYRYAGDFFLWMSFSGLAPLEVVSAMLGGFCVHEGQLSAMHARDYADEARRTPPHGGLRLRLSASLERWRWAMPNRIKRRLNPEMFVFSPAQHAYVRAGSLARA
jgi:glycosyltransferase involved in cell wall biosynthesis